MSVHSNLAAIAPELAGSTGPAGTEAGFKARKTHSRMRAGGPASVSTLVCETDDSSSHSLDLTVPSKAHRVDVLVKRAGMRLIGVTEEFSAKQAQAEAHE